MNQLLLTLLVAIIFMITHPAVSQAQSAFTGMVKDATGAVVPGVTVEARSPALIEGLRSVITDERGSYKILDLRPGTYALTFNLPGFSTVHLEGIDLTSNFTATINAEMKVGSLADSVTVETDAPLVDLQTAARIQVLSREVMDQIPSARSFQAFASLVPGVKLSTPDVGGSQAMEQTYIYGHGNSATHTTVNLDGMNVNSNFSDGLIQNYIDNALIQETSYVTSGVTAEVANGGTFVNMIPKDGGNNFHGSLFMGGTDGKWQSQNTTQALRDRGLNGATKVLHIEDYDGSLGGPFVRNKFWFQGTARYQSTYDSPPNSFYPDGRPGVEEQSIISASMRLSYQINSKMKFSGTYERNIKKKLHELTGLASRPDNPDVSAQRRGGTLYYVAQAKWTYTATPKLLIDAGWSTNVIHYSQVYQKGQEEIPFTPNWYTHVSKVDTVAGIRFNAPGLQNFFLPDRRNITAAISYVTGSHTAKFGFSDAFGKNDRISSINGDIIQQYTHQTVNGKDTIVPQNVLVYNTPTVSRRRVNYDIALYGQDTWNYKRLTTTFGLRWETQKATIQASDVPAGRFVPARQFPLIDCTTIKGLGCWKTFLPRLSFAYDLFGNGKTAVKGSFGKYNTPQDTVYMDNFNAVAPVTDTRSWTDRNVDDVAQDSEIGLSGNPNFGTITNRTLDPKNRREYNLQYNAGVQHQLFSATSVNFNWFRRTNYDAVITRNRAVDPDADWTPFTVVNPLNGEQITSYNLKSTKFGLTPDFYQTYSTDRSTRRNVYTGFEVGTQTRLGKGAHVFGGWTFERTIDVGCDANTVSGLNDPNSYRFCDQSGKLHQDQGKNSKIPFRHEFKTAGNLPLWWHIDASLSMQLAPQLSKTVTWTITRATRYPADCNCGALAGTVVAPTLTNSSLSIPMVSPGSRYLDRLTQVDFGLRRNFKIGEHNSVQAQMDIFNLTNSSTVLSETQTLGSTIKPFVDGGPGGTPQSLIQPRLLRLSLQYRF
jgi:hypothetical protein